MSDPLPLTEAQEERLARYRAGAMADAERAGFEREALADAALSEALYAEGALDALRREAAPPRVVPLPARRSPRLPLQVLLPIAASLVVVSAVLLWRGTAPTPGGDTVRGTEGIRALEPSGELDQLPAQFRWTPEPGATSYRVELYDDADGSPLGAFVTADTAARFSDVTPRTDLTHASWRVTPIGPDGLDRPATAGGTFRLKGH